MSRKNIPDDPPRATVILAGHIVRQFRIAAKKKLLHRRLNREQRETLQTLIDFGSGQAEIVVATWLEGVDEFLQKNAPLDEKAKVLPFSTDVKGNGSSPGRGGK